MLCTGHVYAGIRADFSESSYLWTGEISEDLYDAQCRFTDPTLSFTGVDTFKRNLSSLRWFIDRLVQDYSIELYSCELDENNTCVVATWRMTGTFKFPWRPQLDLEGETTFTYSVELGNRVYLYDERWGMTAGEALSQLLRPGP
jgi:hypothetical protein